MSGSAEPPWYQPCAAAIAQLGGQMCPEDLCRSELVSKYAHAFCTCQPPFVNGCSGPNPPPDCCVFTSATPVPILVQNCFCCCGWSMPDLAADAKSERPLKEYVPGDPVYVAVDVSLQSWESQPVAWSGGVATGGEMVRLVFGDGSELRELVVDRGHPFLTRSGGLKAAAELVAGEDELVAADRSPRTLVSVESGVNGEVHQIATSTSPATSPGGHLIVLNGVVCGDWALQVGLATLEEEAAIR